VKRVLTAMSGGVDSSVAACLLQEGGYEVIGATMRVWRGTPGQLNRCCGTTDVEDARRVAQQLGIPFYVINLEEDFERKVVDYFCEEYTKGRTPNPCILCNERIKFGSLLKKALELNADFVATGHYARLEFDQDRGRYVLKKGTDVRKDQSYVLFSLSQEQLRHTLFPLGSYKKEEVRSKALQKGFRVHDKPESQEICFIQGPSYHSFLAGRAEGCLESGPIVDGKGTVLGTHRGIPFYTIGQRRGLGLAKGRPLYVIGIDREKNTITVGEEKEVYKKRFVIDAIHWMIPPEKGSSFPAQVKIRYNHPGSEALVSPTGADEAEVQFVVAQKAITPGQAAVFYDGETLVGGGWIREVL
jgi:tRNA-uridine 2-sulfurtransferase